MRALAIGLALAVAGCDGVGLWSAPRERGETGSSAASSSGSGGSGSASGSSGSTTSSSGSNSTTATSSSSGSTGVGTSSSTSTSGTTGLVTTAYVETLGQSPGTLTDVGTASDGTLLAVDASENCLESFDGQGQAVAWAGSCGGVGWDQDGQRLSGAQLNGPVGIALSGTTLFVGEQSGNMIRAIVSTGEVSSFSGSGGAGTADGPPSLAQFNSPGGVCADGAGGLFVADTDNHRIRHVDGTGAVQTIAGSSAGFNNDNGVAAQFNFPQAVALDAAGDVYVADSGNCAIRKIAPNHDVSTFAILPVTCGQFQHRLYGVAVDAQGNVFAANFDDGQILRWRPDGTLTAQVTDSSLVQPRGIKLDPQGRVLIANTGQSTVLRMSIP